MQLTSEIKTLAPSREKAEHAMRVNMVIAAALTIFFLLMVAPYRDVHIPRIILGAAMFPFAFIALKLALDDFTRLLLIFVVYAPFQKVLPGTFGEFLRAFNMTNILFVFIIFGWFYRASVRQEKIYTFRKFDMVLGLFIFLSAISLVRGQMSGGHSEIYELIFPLKRWLMPMVMYLVFVNAIYSRDEARTFLTAICISTALIGLWGLKNFYIDKGGAWSTFSNIERARIGLISEQPNELGAFFCYYSFFLLAFFFSYFPVRRAWLFMAAFLVCMRSMLLTFSRGATLAFFSSILVAVYFWKRRIFLFAAVPLLILIIVYPSFIPGVFIGRLKHTFEKRGEVTPEGGVLSGIKGRLDKSSAARLYIWEHGLELVEEHPFIGVGFGRFSECVARRMGQSPRFRVGAHNTYLVIAAEMGIPALLVFLALLAILFYKAYFVHRRTDRTFDRSVSIGFLAGLWGLLISNMFGYRLTSNEVVFYFWILAAVVTRLSEFTAKEVLNETQASEIPVVGIQAGMPAAAKTREGAEDSDEGPD